MDHYLRLTSLIQPRVLLPVSVVVGLTFLPLIANLVDNIFLIRVGIRIMILAIAALSLNVILGYGGMVSLGHAAFIGIGAYVVAILNWHVSNDEPLLSWSLLSWPIVIDGSANA